MKNAWIVACALLFVSVAGFSETPGQVPLTDEALAAILAAPVGTTGSCPTPQNGVLVAAKRPGNGLLKALCTATATCESGTVSCEGNNSTTSCSAVDRNCDNGERGRVTCDGVTTLCPTRCPCDDIPVCCNCDRTGDCTACCRCAGGTFFECSQECG